MATTEQIEKFIPEIITENRPDDNIYIRCIRKKYKCVVIFLLAIIVWVQLITMIIEKTDQNIISTLLTFAFGNHSLSFS